jgi:hypothetical protein
VKQILDGDAVRPMLNKEFTEAIVDRAQPRGKRRAWRAGNRPARDHLVTPAIGVDAAEAGPDGPGIDPEHSHAVEASISC